MTIHDSHFAIEEKKCNCRFAEMKNRLSFSQIVAPFMSTSVGCRNFGNKLSRHFDAMSLVAQTPWKASIFACEACVPHLGLRASALKTTGMLFLFYEILVSSLGCSLPKRTST